MWLGGPISDVGGDLVDALQFGDRDSVARAA
jgi:hypothetical protein